MRLLLPNVLGFSQLRYPALLLIGISKNLLKTLKLQKQLNGRGETCFNRSKYDHSSDFKLNYNILPERYFFDLKAINYLLEV